MNIKFNQETFRDDFTARNSPSAIRRFPFPFNEDSYMYSVNMEPHVKGAAGSAFESLIDVDEHYISEMKDRAAVLKDDPLRCQALPHMMTSQWDTLELLMEQQAAGYPEHFSLTKDGDNWHWINKPLGINQKFVFGDASTLPCEPMEYITRQSQGDFCNGISPWSELGKFETKGCVVIPAACGVPAFNANATTDSSVQTVWLTPNNKVEIQYRDASGIALGEWISKKYEGVYEAKLTLHACKMYEMRIRSLKK